jgi:hypothetical protein
VKLWRLVVALFLVLSYAHGKDYVLIIGGIAGEKSYYDRFWNTTSQFYQLLTKTYGFDPNQVTFLFEDSSLATVADKSTIPNVVSAFHTISISATPKDRFILLMSGHASKSGRKLKFNLPGRDLFAVEYANTILQIPTQSKILFFDFPFSGQMVPLLSHPGMTIITSSSANEGHARSGFGSIMIEQLKQNPAQSLADTFSMTEAKVAQWYREDGAVQAEHPQIFGQRVDQVHLGQPVQSNQQDEGIASPFSQFELVERAAIDDDDSYRSTTVLWREDIFDVNEDSSYTHTVRRTVQIVGDDGRKLGRILIPYTRGNDEIEIPYARTILPNGDIFNLDQSEIKKDLMPPGTIEAGMFVDARLMQFELPRMGNRCVIDYAYVSKNRGHLLAGEFWQQIHIQESVRIEQYKLAINLPRQKQLHYQLHQGLEGTPTLSILPEIKSSNYTTTYQFAIEDVPALVDESFMPTQKDLAYSIAASTIPSWQPLIEWYTTLIREQDLLSDEIAEKVKELTVGAFTRQDKIHRLYDFVTNQIDYVGIELGIWAIKPHAAPQIFQEGYGDCKDKSTLLHTMLSEIGVDSYPVLIAAGESKYVNRQVPSLAYFNHMILAVVENDGTFLYLDPTASGQPFNQLPISDQNRWAMILNPDLVEPTAHQQPLYQFAKTPVQHNNGQRTTTSIQILETKTVVVSQEIQFSGYFNTLSCRHAPDEDGLETKSFFIDLLELDESVKVDKLIFTRLNQFQSRLVIDWQSPDYLISLGHQLLLELPLLPLKYDKLLKDDQRVSPVSLPTTMTIDQSVKINVGKSLLIDQIPENLALQHQIGRVQLTSSSSRHRATIKSVLKLNQTLIPADQFDRLKSLLKTRQQGKRILLSDR